MLTVNIIGAGRVGQTLARLCVKHSVAHITGILNRTLESTLLAIQFIGQGNPYIEVSHLPPADVTILALPDDGIAGIAQRLASQCNLRKGDVVLHCSGALSSECLTVVQSKGALVASIHPMMSFAEPSQSVDLYQNVPCALEGDAEAIAIVQPLFAAIGSLVYTIPKDKKSLYHVAGVLASNYQVTLAQQAFDCLQEAGLEPTLAHTIVLTLLKSTYHNIALCQEPKHALTGPLQRGDDLTIARHIAALQGPLSNLYKVLGKATLPLTSVCVDKMDVLLEILEAE